ncbi:VOC family protein [Pseudonocardia sp.]|uniref:VOC family protein n=1 Tax=Pseudonocardia sp. TaxID=60912 RepID=UPI0039C98834
MARQISAVARELGVVADPSAVQVVEVAVQALVISDVQPFWSAVLGYAERGPVDLVDRHGHGPTLGLQPMDVPRSQRNRIHIDISAPHDQAEARIAAAIAAGGRLITDRYAPAWWCWPTPRATRRAWPPGLDATDGRWHRFSPVTPDLPTASRRPCRRGVPCAVDTGRRRR